VLHLNGYKINNPTILARISHKELEALSLDMDGRHTCRGSDLESMHQAMAATLEHCVLEIRKYQKQARDSRKAFRPRWPMIVLRSPKGWTGPRKVDGKPRRFLARTSNPNPRRASNPAHLKVLETWMKSYKPEEVFDKEASH